MRFYLVRHGQTEWNIEGKVQGKTDIALNETGLLQARLLAGALSGCGASCVYTSTLKRAGQTAEEIAEETGIPVIASGDLREADFGLWEGMTWEEIARDFPQTAAQWEKTPALVTPDGGESPEECRRRCRRIVERIAAEAGGGGRDSGGRSAGRAGKNSSSRSVGEGGGDSSGGGDRESVIVVAHGRILVFVMGYLLRRQEDKPELITKNASISVIDYDPGTGAGELLTLNDCSHLDGLAGGKRGRYC